MLKMIYQLKSSTDQHTVFRDGSVKRGARAEKVESAEEKFRGKSGTKIEVDGMYDRENLE